VEIRESQRRRAGRPERALDPGDSPVSAFASSLRELRRAAGNPSYRKLAERALFAASVLSTAASGCALPSLQVTLAFVGACGGDASEWRQRWDAVAAALTASPAQLPPACPHYADRQAGCALLLGLTDPDSRSRTAGLYRTVLAGRRVLVLLDDAATESEVRPLLATGTSCLVVIV
jgi:hypothetical protein